MTARALVLFVASLSAGCMFMAPVEPNRAVTVGRGLNPTSSALALVYDALVCEVTVRDLSGAVVDQRELNGRMMPLDMKRSMPGPNWQVHRTGAPSRLFTAITVPPGEYELIDYATSDSFEPVNTPAPPPLARTKCDKLDHHAVHLKFVVVANQVTLLALPHGQVTFQDLDAIAAASNDAPIRSTIGTWYPAIDGARKAAFVELVARQRQPRGGYDVYPACNGRTAVVRQTGTPAAWEAPAAGDASAPDDASRDPHLYRPSFPIRSVHATGFGAGCVRPASYVVMLSDPQELDAASRTLGDWLVREDLAGEIDLVVTPIPQNL